MSTALVGGMIIPVVPQGIVYDYGMVTFDDEGVITYVGPASDDVASQCATVVDTRGKLLIPGLVNAHCHSYSNWGKGLLERLPLEIWRQYVKACWRELDDDEIQLAGLLGSIEMLKSGCTTVLDHYFTTLDSEYRGADRMVHAWGQTGMRGAIAPMILDKKFEDTLPLDAGSLGASGPELDRISRMEQTAGLDLVRDLYRTFHDPGGRITVMLGPSAPQRCSVELLQESMALSEELDIYVHMHVAESRAQAAYFMKTYGYGAVEFLRQRNLLSRRLSMAHVCHIPDDEIDHIADAGSTVVHNPVSNLKLGSGIAPISKYVGRGINVALGTDGASSNDSQNMFETMKLSAILQCVSEPDPHRWIAALQALEMATIGGARAMGLGETCGSLEPGKRADIVAIDMSSPAFSPLNDPVRQLVYAENGSDVVDVYVNGTIVVEGGQMTQLDEGEIYSEVRRVGSRLAPGFMREMERTREIDVLLQAMYRGLD